MQATSILLGFSIRPLLRRITSIAHFSAVSFRQSSPFGSQHHVHNYAHGYIILFLLSWLFYTGTADSDHKTVTVPYLFCFCLYLPWDAPFALILSNFLHERFRCFQTTRAQHTSAIANIGITRLMDFIISFSCFNKGGVCIKLGRWNVGTTRCIGLFMTVMIASWYFDDKLDQQNDFASLSTVSEWCADSDRKASYECDLSRRATVSWYTCVICFLKSSRLTSNQDGSLTSFWQAHDPKRQGKNTHKESPWHGSFVHVASFAWTGYNVCL